jgi:hypothetical protein
MGQGLLPPSTVAGPRHVPQGSRREPAFQACGTAERVQPVVLGCLNPPVGLCDGLAARGGLRAGIGAQREN